MKSQSILPHGLQVLESVTRIMLEQRNKDGLTPLMVAAANDHLELVQHFVKLGEQPIHIRVARC